MWDVDNIEDVVARHLCCGCGACAYVCADGIEMIDAREQGRVPVFRSDTEHNASEIQAMCVCPGVELTHSFDRRDRALIGELLPAWGPVREIWEGYASDPEIRLAGSSGGVATALALYGIEKGGMYGALHTVARKDIPYLNHTVLSRTRGEFLAAAGSRYAPASPCDGLKLIEDAAQSCVFIGKPCDVAATWKARSLRPSLEKNLGLTVAIFCAGTPSTEGTLEMLRAMGVEDPSSVVRVGYRGSGWPGKASATFSVGGKTRTRELSYEESWGRILQKHRLWRCRICPDHTGEFADIAVGDPWYREIPEGEPGRSLVLARTERGREVLAGAIRSGHLTLKRADPQVLPMSQPSLLRARGSVWGRVFALRCLGIPAPRYRRFGLFRDWWSHLSVKEKVKSILGTVKRAFTRRLRQRCVAITLKTGHKLDNGSGRPGEVHSPGTRVQTGADCSR